MNTTKTDSASDGTPPEKIVFPLTPPASGAGPSNPRSSVSAALDFIKERQRYQSTDQLRRFKVDPSDYMELLATYEKDDKLRFNYDPLKQILHLPRMPTTKHESFLAQISEETTKQLHHIKEDSSNDEAARFAARIHSIRSGNIYLREIDPDDDIETDLPYILRQPDDQFKHEEAEYPGIVYEIACSQDSSELSKKAWTYIQYSNGNIKAVIGLDLGYGKNKEARISMWEPRYEEDDQGDVILAKAIIDRDLFRLSDGSATNITNALHIPLACFADSEVVALKSEDLPGITITYSRLAEFLETAERLQRTNQSELGEASTGKKSVRKTVKRRRPSTSSDELSSDIENKFRTAESDADRRASVEDEDFVAQTTVNVNIPERRMSVYQYSNKPCNLNNLTLGTGAPRVT